MTNSLYFLLGLVSGLLWWRLSHKRNAIRPEEVFIRPAEIINPRLANDLGDVCVRFADGQTLWLKEPNLPAGDLCNAQIKLIDIHYCNPALRKCVECADGHYELIARAGRTTHFKDSPDFEIPADMWLNECLKCGSMLFYRADIWHLDEARNFKGRKS